MGQHAAAAVIIAVDGGVGFVFPVCLLHHATVRPALDTGPVTSAIYTSALTYFWVYLHTSCISGFLLMSST